MSWVRIVGERVDGGLAGCVKQRVIASAFSNTTMAVIRPLHLRIHVRCRFGGSLNLPIHGHILLDFGLLAGGAKDRTLVVPKAVRPQAWPRAPGAAHANGQPGELG